MRELIEADVRIGVLWRWDLIREYASATDFGVNGIWRSGLEVIADIPDFQL